MNSRFAIDFKLRCGHSALFALVLVPWVQPSSAEPAPAAAAPAPSSTPAPTDAAASGPTQPASSAPPASPVQLATPAPEGSAPPASAAPEAAPAGPAAAAAPAPSPTPAVAAPALTAKAPPAPPVEEPPPPDPNTLPRTYQQKHLDAQIGVGSAWSTSSSMDPFTAKDASGQFNLRLGAFPLASGRFAFGVLTELSYSSFSGTARSSPTSLGLTGLGLGLEARYHFHHRYYAFLRATPGASYAQATLSQAGSETLSDTSWAFAFGGHIGAGARIWGPDDGSVRAPRGWLILEGGYRFADSQALSLSAPPLSSVDTDPWQPEPVSTSGPDLGISLALTY